MFVLYCFLNNNMKIIFDEREKSLYEQCSFILSSQATPSYAQLSSEMLTLGDILIKTDEDQDLLLIERKTFPDLIASIKDGRYEEQSYRLLHSSGFPLHSIIYLLEGNFSQLINPIEKRMVYSAMTSLHFFKGFSVHRTLNVRETAEWLLLMIDKIEKDFNKGKMPYYLSTPFLKRFQNNSSENLENEMTQNEPKTEDYCSVVKKTKKENITQENIGHIILCQIPGISSTTAISIMKPYNNFYQFMESIKNNPSLLENLTYESKGKQRKISKTSIEKIKKYLFNIE